MMRVAQSNSRATAVIPAARIRWRAKASRRINATFTLAIALGLLYSSIVLGQNRRSGSRSNGSSGSPDAIETAVARFDGVLRVLDKKSLRIDLNDGQSLVFHRSKHTTLVPSGGHSRIETGAKVQVEAHKDKVGDLDAVRVCEGTCPSGR